MNELAEEKVPNYDCARPAFGGQQANVNTLCGDLVIVVIARPGVVCRAVAICYLTDEKSAETFEIASSAFGLLAMT